MKIKQELFEGKYQHNGEWKDIAGYEDMYMVNRMGDVKGLKVINVNEDLFKLKYANNNETYEGMCNRVAFTVEQAELMKKGLFMPAGRHLAARNTNTRKTLFNCYGLGVINDGCGVDSRKGINSLEGRADEVSSAGGGIGVCWSFLRPRGAVIGSNNSYSSGQISFMDRFAYGQAAMTQGGGRRGANMGLTNDWHPSVFEFIDSKQDLSKMNNMNISVILSDEFMRAVKEDADWELVFPDYEVTGKKIYNDNWNGKMRDWKALGLPVKVYETVKAKSIFDKIVVNAHTTGEPGVVFEGNVNRVSNTLESNWINVCNPCGELMLCAANTSCNLGSINLSALTSHNGTVDFVKLDRVIYHGILYLDAAIEAEVYFDDEIEKNQKYYRQIGLGVMGYADMLIKMGLVYGSKEALAFTEKLAAFILDRAYYASALLSKEKGRAPVFKETKLNDFYVKKCSPETQEMVAKYGLRNATVLSIAPTGSIAMLLGINGGIEPYYKFRYERNDVMGKRIIEANIVSEAPNRECLIEASDVDVAGHVETQSVWQQYIDSSISKTLNIPNTATKEDVAEAYLLSFDRGCKGTTVYRDGSREGVLTDVPKVLKNKAKLPTELYAKRNKIKVKGDNFYFVTSYRDKELSDPVELFIVTNKSVKNDVTETILGSLRALMVDAGVDEVMVGTMVEKAAKHRNIDKIARYISMGLRHNVPIHDIVGEMLDSHEHIGSLVYQVTKHLMSLIKTKVESQLLCPECGEKLMHVEGCLSCSCGYSRC